MIRWNNEHTLDYCLQNLTLLIAPQLCLELDLISNTESGTMMWDVDDSYPPALKTMVVLRHTERFLASITEIHPDVGALTRVISFEQCELLKQRIRSEFESDWKIRCPMVTLPSSQ